MLVLTRKIGETIVLGADITITVVHMSGNRVRLGIVAPKDMPVRRHELRPGTTPRAGPPRDGIPCPGTRAGRPPEPALG